MNVFVTVEGHLNIGWIVMIIRNHLNNIHDMIIVL